MAQATTASGDLSRASGTGHAAAATTSSEGGTADDGGELGSVADTAHGAAATTAAEEPVADTGDASASQLSEEARKAGKQG